MEIIKAFSKEEINHQLQRILDTPAFKNSPTLSRFLAFIVAETIEERQQYIKEYSIAINVLYRQSDFNPHDDAVVRIHAGRLRRALNEYYLIQGINDPIIIHIPKGAYIPQFEVGRPEKTVEVRSTVLTNQKNKPVLAVFPFHTMPQEPEIKEFSLLLVGQLSAELSSSRDISVLGYYSAEMIDKIEHNAIDAGKSLGADYIMTGILQQSGQNIRLLILVLNTLTGGVLMANSFDKKVIFPHSFEIQDEIVQSVISEWNRCAYNLRQPAPAIRERGSKPRTVGSDTSDNSINIELPQMAKIK